MSYTKPVVSIGVPVYNGENYLAAALDSILAQTFSDFELIISDNASTDGTEEICRSYQARDARIRYYRNSRDLGAAKNSNLVFELSSGKYFKWASHDDVLGPDFLSRCVPVLEQDSSVVLCHCKVMLIDDFNKKSAPLEEPPGFGASHSPSERFGRVIFHDRVCADIFGLIRSRTLSNTSLIGPHVASDRTLRAELAMLGRFHQVPEYLFFLRDHAGRSVRAMPSHHQRVAWFDPDRTGKRVFPYWRILLEYQKAVRRSPLTAAQRFRCYLHLLRWIGRDSNWARMAADVVIAAKPDSWRFLYKLAGSYDRDLISPHPQPGSGSRRSGDPGDGGDLADVKLAGGGKK